jgi:FkbM family methyltransferase
MNPADPVHSALAKIAVDPALRASFIQAILRWEQTEGIVRRGLRDAVSGPLVDALHAKDEILRKQLSDGTIIEFLYRSKIARELVLSVPEAPDHVWEPQTTRLLRKLVRRAATAVIGGAYFGDHVVLVAKEMQAQRGRVHAFEPCPAQREMLHRNLKLNQLDNVEVRGLGLWDTSRTTQLLDASDAYGSLMKEVRPEHAVRIETVSLDDYLGAQGVEAVDLVMLDLEGAEERALHGAARYLSMPADKAPNLIFEINREYVDWSPGLHRTEIVQWLTGLGYHVYCIRDIHANHDMKATPIEIVPCDDVYLEGPPHGFNMLAVKRPALMGEIGLRVVKGVSPKLFPHKDPAIFQPAGGMP